MTPREIGRGTVIGTIAGTIVGWLPGLSNATANAVLCSKTDYRRDRRAYIFSTSAANTANAIIGLAALFAIGRERNGVMVAISSVGIPFLASPPCIGCACCLPGIPDNHMAVRLCRSSERDRWKNAELRCNYPDHPDQFPDFRAVRALHSCPGLYCGLIPGMVNISRVYCMGAIMIPVILYSFGIGGF